MRITTKSPEESLALRTERQGECLVWTGCKLKNGYGLMRIHGTKQRAVVHRVAWELANGKIPEGMQIDHMCHNKACILLEHLRVVTNKQNHENKLHLSSANTSGARGVFFDKTRGKWYMSVTHYGRTYRGGAYGTFEEAKAAAIAKRNELFTHNDSDRA